MVFAVLRTTLRLEGLVLSWRMLTVSSCATLRLEGLQKKIHDKES